MKIAEMRHPKSHYCRRKQVGIPIKWILPRKENYCKPIHGILKASWLRIILKIYLNSIFQHFLINFHIFRHIWLYICKICISPVHECLKSLQEVRRHSCRISIPRDQMQSPEQLRKYKKAFKRLIYILHCGQNHVHTAW